MEVRKRKQRAILSCIDCRRRKLKCDRELPCNRCVGGGYPEKCGYSLIDGEDADPSPVKRVRRSEKQGSPQVSEERVGHLERQLSELREVVRQLASKSEHADIRGDEVNAGQTEETHRDDRVETKEANVGLFKGRAYRTFYYGPTSPITVAAHFPNLRPFMKRVYIGSSLQKLRQDTKTQEEGARLKHSDKHVLTVPNLRSLLPDRDTVDKLVKTYFDTFETTYRVLHAPTFWTTYTDYWDAPHEYSPNSEMDAIILGILACTLCTSIHETPRYNTQGSSFRSKAVVWIKACDAWLKRQSNKHRTLASLQVRLLRLLALSTTCLKTKEYYQEVQAHMAFMISSGIHRDPGILGLRCSVFEAEMRRRLWATSMEIEMQASIDKGISFSLSSLEFDCATPGNINDSDLHPGINSLPNSQPGRVFTDTSYLHHSVRSLSLRAKLLSTANSPQRTETFSVTLQDEQEILNAIQRIPAWKDSRALQASTLLKFQLRQFLVIIYTQRALNTDPRLRWTSEHRYASTTILEACETLIILHTHLLSAKNFALCCIRFDYLRSMLLICHISYHASLASDTFLTRIAKPIFQDTKEMALQLLEERSMRPGRGNHHYWYTSAAISLVDIQYCPDNRVVFEREATERVSNLLYRMMALQNEEPEGQPAQVVLEDTPVSAMHTPVSFVAPMLGSDEVGLGGIMSGLEGFQDGTVAAWDLDDFWFMGGFEGDAMGGV